MSFTTFSVILAQSIQSMQGFNQPSRNSLGLVESNTVRYNQAAPWLWRPAAANAVFAAHVRANLKSRNARARLHHSGDEQQKPKGRVQWYSTVQYSTVHSEIVRYDKYDLGLADMRSCGGF